MRSIRAIATDFDSLTAADFDESDPSSNGMQRLHSLCAELEAANDVTKSAPMMFRLMERLDGAHLGSPSPLVHTLERWGGFESFLEESLSRKPSFLAIWMVNRILNSDPPGAEKWMIQLRSVQNHRSASATTKQMAAEFLDWQRERSTQA